MGDQEGAKRLVTGADLVRDHLRNVQAGDKRHPSMIARDIGLDEAYVRRLLLEQVNATVGPPDEEGCFERLEDPLTVAPSGVVWSSMRPHKSNPDSPGAVRHIWRRKTS